MPISRLERFGFFVCRSFLFGGCWCLFAVHVLIVVLSDGISCDFENLLSVHLFQLTIKNVLSHSLRRSCHTGALMQDLRLSQSSLYDFLKRSDIFDVTWEPEILVVMRGTSCQLLDYIDISIGPVS